MLSQEYIRKSKNLLSHNFYVKNLAQFSCAPMAQVSQEVAVMLLPGTMGSSEDSTSKWRVGRTYAFNFTWLLTNISPSPLRYFHRGATWWYSLFPPEWAKQEKSRENAQRGGHNLFITYSQEWHPNRFVVFYSLETISLVHTQGEWLYKGVTTKRYRSLVYISEAVYHI